MSQHIYAFYTLSLTDTWGQLFATGTSLHVIVDFLLFQKLIPLFSGEISCCTIIFECVLNNYPQKQWIIQLTSSLSK